MRNKKNWKNILQCVSNGYRFKVIFFSLHFSHFLHQSNVHFVQREKVSVITKGQNPVFLAINDKIFFFFQMDTHFCFESTRANIQYWHWLTFALEPWVFILATYCCHLGSFKTNNNKKELVSAPIPLGTWNFKSLLRVENHSTGWKDIHG